MEICEGLNKFEAKKQCVNKYFYLESAYCKIKRKKVEITSGTLFIHNSSNKGSKTCAKFSVKAKEQDWMASHWWCDSFSISKFYI